MVGIFRGFTPKKMPGKCVGGKVLRFPYAKNGGDS